MLTSLSVFGIVPNYFIERKAVFMSALRWILTILLIIDAIALTIIVLMQEGRSQGLGAIAGAAETYWGKNKGRSMEGMLEKITIVLVILFFVVSLLLNIKRI